jgi:hypothetical protein
MIETLTWILPRPRTNPSYKGGFPRHFEVKLMRLYNMPDLVLHPFEERQSGGWYKILS